MPGLKRGSGRNAALALALLCGPLAGPAEAGDAPAAGISPCVARYRASLQRIEGAEYQAVRSADRAAAAADDALPGALLFPPGSVTGRSKPEVAALRAAAALARGKGRMAGTGDEGGHWMADRLRLGLSDYLTQSPSPYLCHGVETYVATLRGFSARLGALPRDLDAAVAAERAVAARSLLEAFAALRTASAPRPAPDARAPATPDLGLRPGAGIERTDPATTGAIGTAGPRAAAADGPAPAANLAPPLETAADLAAAVDRLAAAAGGVLVMVPNETAAGRSLAAAAATYPVLARLAAVRPAVFADRPVAGDRLVRRRLVAAFASIETLDYLMRARARPADPLATAIDATFEAILKAGKADCTCKD